MKLPTIIGKTLKVLLGVLLVPIAIGSAQAFLDELDRSGVGTRPFFLGCAIYLFIHLVIYKVTWLYAASHAVLSRIAGFFFGGKVVAMGGGGGDKGPAKEQGDGKSGGSSDGGRPLAVLSPYLVPTYVILLTGGLAIAGMWHDLGGWQRAIAGTVGAMLTFHWIMTLETIQQRKETIASAGYVLSVVLIFLVSLSLTAVLLPLAVRGFNGLAYLASAYDASRALYVAVFHQLFG